MLIRTDPFQVFDQLSRQLAGAGTWTRSLVPMDAYRSGDEFVVAFDLPGVDPGTIDVSIERNVLTVKAERQAGGIGDDVQVQISERPQGVFTRQVFLGESLDTERVEAGYDAGVLTVRIPVAERAKPRKIEITGSSRPQINA